MEMINQVRLFCTKFVYSKITSISLGPKTKKLKQDTSPNKNGAKTQGKKVAGSDDDEDDDDDESVSFES